jgi:hypothetical protein
MLQDFRLEGSNDGALWRFLHVHNGDRSINDSFANYTWTFDNPVTVAYRYFRIIQTDRNQGGLFYLSMSGFELFGTLFGTPTTGDAVCGALHRSVFDRAVAWALRARPDPWMCACVCRGSVCLWGKGEQTPCAREHPY